MHVGITNLDQFIKTHKKFIISTHESPDGDGLGAEIAFKELLYQIGKEAVILNSDPTPGKYSFIDIDNEINVLDDNFKLKNISEYSVFVLDTNDFNNIGAAYNMLKEHINNIFIIDHHEGGKDKFESNYIRADASSASEIIYDIIKHYKIEPSFKAAQALYAGILFDTGSFRYPKTSPKTHKIISHLIKIGADPFKIYEQIYENNSLSSFELRALMLASMEILFNGKLILLKLTKEMLKKSEASFNEGELNINLPLTVTGVVASILVKQDLNGPVKVSMRTKGDYDVASIAIDNGGGGHKNAAGYKSKLSFEETCKKVIDDVRHFFP